jgi:hypothetical protein
MKSLEFKLPVWEFELPTPRELESQLVCGLIRFILHQRHHNIPGWIHRAADSAYGRPDTLELSRQWLFKLGHTISLEELEHWKAQGLYEAVRLNQWFNDTHQKFNDNVKRNNPSHQGFDDERSNNTKQRVA